MVKEEGTISETEAADTAPELEPDAQAANVELKSADGDRVLYIPRDLWQAAGEPATIEEFNANRPVEATDYVELRSADGSRSLNIPRPVWEAYDRPDTIEAFQAIRAAREYVELRPADGGDRVLNLQRSAWEAAGKPKTIEDFMATRASP